MAIVRVWVVLMPPLLALWACSGAPRFITRYEPWRAKEERACLATGLVRETPFVTARASLGGPTACGALKPFKVTATASGSVTLDPPVLVRCPMVHALEHWTEHVVRPAARHHLGADIVAVNVLSSYSCRPMNNIDGALLSEHGHANAVDVSGFLLGNGLVVTVKEGWHGSLPERRFLRTVHGGSCAVFTTVLGPDYDRLHHDHLHIDLARRPGDERICK